MDKATITTLITGYLASNWPALIGAGVVAFFAGGGWKYLPKIANGILGLWSKGSKKIEATTVGKNMPNILATINEIVQDKVMELMEVAEAAKEKAADGKLTQKDIDELHDMVYKEVIEQLDDDAMALAHSAIKDIKRFVVSKIKAKVTISKKKLPSSMSYSPEKG